VIPLLDLPPAGQVLDVGCGYGGLALLLAQTRSDLHIVGVDRETGALESAAQTALQAGWANVEFVQGDGHQLEYPANRFDAVVREMARVLKPGGVFMAAEYTSSGAYLGPTTSEIHNATKPGIKGIFGWHAYSCAANKPSVAAMTGWVTKFPPWRPLPGWTCSMCG
jgi:ubiquinone/menaquinone biosynthesis C-methylase UbiE